MQTNTKYTNQTTVHIVKTENDQKAKIVKNDNKEVKFSFLNRRETIPYFP